MHAKRLETYLPGTPEKVGSQSWKLDLSPLSPYSFEKEFILYYTV